MEIKQRPWFFLWRWCWNAFLIIFYVFACDGDGLKKMWARRKKLGYLSFKINEAHEKSVLKITCRKDSVLPFDVHTENLDLIIIDDKYYK